MKPRFVIFMTLFFVAIIGVNLWQYFSSGSEYARQQLADQLGDTLLAQNGRLLINYIQHDQDNEIEVLLNSLAQLDIVQSSALYLPNGVSRYQTSNDQPIANFRHQSPMPLIYLRPLFENNQLLGFVKLVMDSDKVTAHLKEFNQVSRNIGWVLFVLGMLCAFLMVSGLFQTRDKS